MGKVVEYEFDPGDGTLERMVAKPSAAGAEGDPVEFVFDQTTGILTQYKYGATGVSDDVTLTYNANMELTLMTDWLGTKEYEYDDVGRITTVIDYNDAETSFTYDDAGQVLTMTDTHGGVTTAYSYTYTPNGQVATITSPGNKLWEFEYNDLGQPTVMTYPNGMVKEWAYDQRDRLQSLVYRDQPLGNVLASYTYVLDDLFNVTAMVEADGTIWTYEYDDRYRLTEAVRHNHIFTTIKANRMPLDTLSGYRKTYLAARGESAIPGVSPTYDASGNMLTKVEPFEDTFNDTNFTGWTPLNSSWWQVVDGKLTTVVQSWTHVMEKQFSDADHELQFDYINKNTSNNSYGISATLRQATAGGRVAVTFFPNRAELSEYVPGTGWVVRATDTGATTTQDATYHVKGVCDGSSVKVWRWQDGEMPAQVFSYTTAYTDSWRIYFSTPAYSNFAIDNVRILADDLSTTSTFTVNDADELVSMATTYGGDRHHVLPRQPTSEDPSARRRASAGSEHVAHGGTIGLCYRCDM